MLFTDGGVGSNFPMHFFDALLVPTRPTFRINLAPEHPLYPSRWVWRLRHARRTEIRSQPGATLAGFGAAILDTMRNCPDTTMLAQRGYAARVVEVRLRPNEGGINLHSPEAVILRLAKRGNDAGQLLLADSIGTSIA